MRQAIVTKYFGPTNHKGSRVKATAEAGSVTLPWDHALDTADNHRLAAEALCREMSWHFERLLGGGLPDGRGYCWLMLDKDDYTIGPIEDGQKNGRGL